jgi:predicted PurR-regulated permease PerM
MGGFLNLSEKNSLVIGGVTVLLLLAAFLWSIQAVLSPLLVGGFLLYILLAFQNYSLARRLFAGITLVLVVWFFIHARGVLFPFIVSFVLAYLFKPLADTLEHWRIPRTLGVLILLVLTLGILVLGGMILIPSLVKEIQELIRQIPKLAVQLADLVTNTLSKLLASLKIDGTKIQQGIMEEIPSRAEKLLLSFSKGLAGIGTFLGQIFNIVLIPILTFYFLKDYERIRRWILDFIPRRYRNIVTFYQWRLNRILGGYIRGQLIVCSIVGILTGTGLALFRIPFAVLLGVLAGLLNVIPYIGLYISLVLALIAAFFTSKPLIAMIKIGGIFLFVQSLEGYIISPKIVGKRVGLHPLAVIFSILIFSRFFGFWGLIIGVPTTALIKFLIDEWKRRQKWREILVEKSTTHHH